MHSHISLELSTQVRGHDSRIKDVSRLIVCEWLRSRHSWHDRWGENITHDCVACKEYSDPFNSILPIVPGHLGLC